MHVRHVVTLNYGGMKGDIYTSKNEYYGSIFVDENNVPADHNIYITSVMKKIENELIASKGDFVEIEIKDEIDVLGTVYTYNFKGCGTSSAFSVEVSEVTSGNGYIFKKEIGVTFINIALLKANEKLNKNEKRNGNL